MFSSFELKKYSDRQQEFNTERDKRRNALDIQKSLAEANVNNEAAMARQESVNKTGLEQERMQQEGATTRATPMMQKVNLENTVSKVYGMKDAEADYTKATLANEDAKLGVDFKRALQPTLQKDMEAKSAASIAQSNRYGTYYSGEQAKDERTAILGHYQVGENGIVSNKKEYFDPVFGAGNLQNDLREAAVGDADISNNRKIKPKFSPILKPHMTRSSLSPLSNGKLPTP